MCPVGAGGAGPRVHPAQPGRGQRAASKSNKERDKTVRNNRVCLAAWTGVFGERTETEQRMSLCGHAFLLFFFFFFQMKLPVLQENITTCLGFRVRRSRRAQEEIVLIISEAKVLVTI